MRTVLLRAFAILAIGLTAASAAPVSFKEEIAPLLQRRCATCHNEENAKGHYQLDTFQALQKPGESDLPPLVAGKAHESELYRLLIEPGAEDRMPQKAEPLPTEEIELIKRWLDEGAQYDAGSPTRPLVELARETLLRRAPEIYARPLPVTALAFSGDGRLLASSGYYEVLIWNLEDGSLAKRIQGLPERITALAWHPKRNLLAIAGGSPGQWGTVALIDPDKTSEPRILGDFSETALAVAFSPDGKTLAVGGGDRTVRLFDTGSGKEQRVAKQHADWVQSVSFSRDGRRILTASRDRTARVLNVSNGDVEATYTEHETALLAATFLGDGSRALSVDRSRTVHEWDANSGNKRSTFADFPGEPQMLLVHDNQLIAAGGSPLITIHQLSDRQRLFTLAGHHDSVQSMALAPSGYVLASGSADGEVLLWDLRCGTWTHRFTASPVGTNGRQITSTQ
ncbi:c-type cytochrome domain-containing protein [Verrucomicrobiota bacterium sgz303538]